jgi:hypothetical protein
MKLDGQLLKNAQERYSKYVKWAEAEGDVFGPSAILNQGLLMSVLLELCELRAIVEDINCRR